MVLRDAAGDGARRHARPRRRRLSSLFGRRRLARAAFREDAVRPGAARAGVSRGRAGVRRSVLPRGRRGHAALRHARDDRRGRRLLLGRGRRQRPAGAARRAAAPHKTEGAFYLWRADEVDALLGDDAAIVKRRFGIEPSGNAPSDPQQEFTGKNLLYVARSVDDARRQSSAGRPTRSSSVLSRARLRMFERGWSGRGRISTTRC